MKKKGKLVVSSANSATKGFTLTVVYETIRQDQSLDENVLVAWSDKDGFVVNKLNATLEMLNNKDKLQIKVDNYLKKQL